MAARLPRVRSTLALLAAMAMAAPCLAADAIFKDGFDPLPLIPSNDAETARFLTQATFGPTLADIAHVRDIGYGAWIDEQLAEPAADRRTRR